MIALAVVLGGMWMVGTARPVKAAGTIIDINPSNPGSFVPITQVVLDDNGTIVTQTTEADANNRINRATPVNLVSVTVNDGGNLVVLNQFSLGGDTVELLGLANPAYDPGNPNKGLGVLQSDGTRVLLRDDREAFRQALESTLTNTNLNNYVHYDEITPPSGGHPRL